MEGNSKKLPSKNLKMNDYRVGNRGELGPNLTKYVDQVSSQPQNIV